MLRQEGRGALQTMRSHVRLQVLLPDYEEMRPVSGPDRPDGADFRVQRRSWRDL